jgi:hypothetical protein
MKKVQGNSIKSFVLGEKNTPMLPYFEEKRVWICDILDYGFQNIGGFVKFLLPFPLWSGSETWLIPLVDDHLCVATSQNWK